MNKNKVKIFGKTLSYKTLSYVLLAVLCSAFFAFGGLNRAQSAIVNLQKWLAENEEIDGKTQDDNHDGTYKLSLSVTGDADAETEITTKANVLVVYDVSNSMSEQTYRYTATTSTSNNTTQYGLVNGRYVQLERYSQGGSYHWRYNNGTQNVEYTGTRYTRANDGERGLKAEKVVYDFASALFEYNETTPDTVEMALVTFSGPTTTNANTSTDNATTIESWTSTGTNITRHLSSNGTSRPAQNLRLNYTGGTNWEAAMQKAQSVLNDLPAARKNEPTFVIFVTDGAPTFRLQRIQTSYGNGNSYYGHGTSTIDDRQNYLSTTDEVRAIQTLTENTNLYGIYAYGSEGDLLDDLVHYARTGVDRTNGQNQAEWAGTAATAGYYNAADTDALESAISDIFSSIVEALGISNASIHDGTTANVETTSGEISHLLDVDETSYKYTLSMPVEAVSGSNSYTMARIDSLTGEYTITLVDNGNGTVTATWGTNEVTLKGEINLGKFEYEWEEANAFYNVAPPEAHFVNGAVDWNLGTKDDGGVGTLLDGVTYTVSFDVYPSQETYDMVAEVKNAEDPAAAYNALDKNIRDYLIRNNDGSFSLKTNTNATLTYTDTRDGNTTPTTKTFKNPEPVPAESSVLKVKKNWINDLDWRQAPEGTELEMKLKQNGVETNHAIYVSKDNDWEDEVEIATGLLKTVKGDAENPNKITGIRVLDPGHDYTLTEPESITYHWELKMEVVHPMIIDGVLTTLVEVPTKEIPTEMGDEDTYYSNSEHSFYRFNGKVYYDKTIDAHLNAYNTRKSNFNFIKVVEGDPVGGEEFNFTFKINDKNIDESKISTITDPEVLMNEYSIWFSVCDTNNEEDPTCSTGAGLVKDSSITNATPESGDTGYFYALDNSTISVKLKDGWNVRVTNVGTGTTYEITEAAPTEPFALKSIDGTITVRIQELPVNAEEVSEGVYSDGTYTYTKIYETENDGSEKIFYEYEYTPDVNIANRKVNGVIVAPNTSSAVTFTNNYPKTHLVVDKQYIGEEKPVVVQLYRKSTGAEEEVGSPVTLNEDNNWKYEFKDLDTLDAQDKVYEYYVKETALDGYKTTYSGNENIEISATDIPENVTQVPVKVTITGKTASENEEYNVTLTRNKDYKYTIENINYLNEDGTVKTTSVTSTSTATIHYALTERTNTITNEERTVVEGEKTWEDENDQDGVRPESITVKLIADGDKDNPVATLVVTEDDDWSWKWEDLPKYKAVTEDGETTYVEIEYTVEETEVTYYETENSETGYDITNTHTPFESTVTVVKSWNDANDQDGVRPTSITLVLKDSNGLIIQDANNNGLITLTAENDWTFTKVLPRRSNKTDLTYTVQEIGVVTEDYTAEIADPVASTTTGTNDNQTITLNIENTHTPEVIELSGEKTWVDADNQDGKRPTSITVTLYADGTAVEGKTITVSPDEDGNWKYDFGELPKYAENQVGHEIEYTVRENDLSSIGYTASYEDGENLDITNTYTPEVTTVNGTKTWDDANDQDGLRPTSITLQLYADGTAVEGKTVTITADEDGNWPTYTFANLPKYKNTGTANSAVTSEIEYTVRDTVEGYTSSTDSKDVINTHTPELITVNGAKTWDDDNNRDGKRPESITIQLLADGEEVEGKVVTVTPAEDGSWSWSFEDLPKYRDHGTEIVYTVSESGVDTDDYTITVNGTDVTNTHIPEKTTVDGTKTWTDNDDQDGVRPESITINLIADGDTENPVDSVTVTEEDGWAYSFTDLDKYKPGEVGHEIEYTVEEVEVTYYEATPNGYDIENTHTPFESTVTIVKTWSDANNQDGKRPDAITLVLKDSNGLIIQDANNNGLITLTAENNWTFTKVLPRRNNKTDLTYTVQEVGVVTEDYTAVIADPEASTTTGTNDNQTITLNIDNQHTPETVSVEGSKTWDDADNQDGKRPESIIINLLADGEVIASKTVTEDDNWAWSWTELPKYLEGQEGVEIEYTITENEVENYTTEISGYDVINTHTPEKTEVEGSKTWDDADNQDGMRPESITINLLANGEKVDSVTVTEEDNWAWSFTDLDKYADGVEITYTITEDEVEGYITEVNEYDVVNTHTPEKTEVNGVKNWVDNNDQDGVRPESITINLLADGEVIDSVTVTENDDWAYSFKNLDKYRDEGIEISYTITEDEVDDYATSYTGYDVTNTHIPGKTYVSGSKTWDDNNDQDGVRPESITINLLADGEVIDSVTVTENDNWAWSFTDLDEFANGVEIVYTITEDEVEGYTTEVNGYDVVNTHTPELTEVEGSKTWVDNDDQDGIRPESITINLLADGEQVDSVTVTEEDNWSWSFTELDKYRDGGVEIVYTITEDEIEGYTTTVEDYNVTNTHTPEKTEVEGAKTWDDNDNQDGVRPASITINLLADGEQVDSVTVTEEDNWAWSFTELDKYKDGGVEIVYTITEDEIEGYTTEVNGYDVVNTHTPELTEVEGSKTWDDNNDQDGVRPASITINLLADGEIIDSVAVTEEDNWSWSFTELDKYRDGGVEIVYTITEDEVEGYTTEVNGYDVVNTHTPELTEVEGAKTWDDNNDQDGVRPASITINLLADGEQVDSITVTADEGWAWSFTGLDKYRDGGVEIIYTITEDEIDGYTTEVNGYDVVNTHTPELTEVEGSKTWDDNDNQDGVRPESITINLLADGEVIDSVAVTEEDNWAWSFTELDKYRDEGIEIIYTITEDEVEGYTTEVNGYDVVNTHTPEKTEVEGSKTWDDNDNQDGVRPESITINLLADGEVIDSAVISAEEGWAWSFTNLDKYKDEGTEIVYTITEDEIEGYTTEVNGYDVVNTHTPELTEVEGSKTWDDNDDQDGVRPESITINLLADGEQVDSITVTEEDNWAWSFTELDKYRDGGVEIVYTITEDEIEGYNTEVNGYDVVNTHTPEKTEVEGSKTWVDNDDQDGVRPASITINLLADGEQVDSITVTEEDNWSWSFTELDKYKDGGVEIVYSITEDEIDGYTTTIEDYNVTNTHTPEKTEVEGSKTWDDNDDQDGVRPESITINLLADGEVIDTVTVTEEDNWAWSFTDLDIYRDGGVEIVYTITEDEIEGYTTEVNGYDVVNTHTPEKTEVEGYKTWVDNDDQDGKRPESIKINLLADGEFIDTVTVTEEDNWSWSFTELDKYKDGGVEIVYTITEDEVTYYTTTIQDYNVTNTHTPGKTQVEGYKKWEDDDNRDGIRPESVTINLLADGEVIDSVVVTEEDEWLYSFTDLDIYRDGGVEIEYSITEDEVEGYTTEVRGYDVVNIHEPERTKVEGSKTWVDNDNQDGVRPDTITITLFADDEQFDSIKVTEEDNWSWSFTNLIKYRDEGTEIVYSIREDEIDGYTTTIKDYNVTNTHTPEKTEVEGNKSWDDNDDQDGVRPESIIVRLHADGEEIESATITAQDNWSWSFTDLDKYRDEGTEIVYTITEDEVEGYTTEISGYNVINTHNPEKTEVEGIKSWDDNDDQDGIRPDSITVNLLADGTVVDSQTITEDDGWAYSFTDLDKFKDGVEIVYTVAEDDVEGYTAEVTDDGIINTHVPETTTVDGIKTWEDEEDQDGVRPASIDITLKADGKELETITVTETEGWSWSWTDLPKYKEHGTEIVYTVEEGEVTYYDATPSETGFDITNTHNPFKTSIKVVKKWDDAENQDGKRPTSVTFTLMQDGVKMFENIELNEDNNWTYENNGLPRRAAGKDIVYSVVEVGVDTSVYTSSNETESKVEVNVNDNQETVITVTNKHDPEKVDVEGAKTWTDADNQDGMRPESITVHLLANNEIIDTKEVTENDNWAWSWTELDKYKDGEEIAYSVSEDQVDNYTTVVNGYDIENTHEPETVDVEGEKVWSDSDDQDGLRPTSVVITLYADGEAIDTASANVDNNWAFSFTGLPKYKVGEVGQEVEYTVGEAEADVPEGYTASVSGTTVTNTHTPEEVEISGEKVWNDNSNQDGVRPTSITVRLYADGDEVDYQTVTGGSTDDKWSYSFTGLPKYKDHGTEIIYTVNEDEVENYTVEVNGTTITNAHASAKVNVPVSKTWVDSDNKEKLRPTTVNVSLLADDEEVATADLSEDNNWSYEWTELDKFRDEGVEIVYTVRENNIDDNYEVSYPTATTIVNTIKNLSKDIPVTKVWDDNSNQDGKRPEVITLTLTGTVPEEEEPVVTRTLELSTADVNAEDNNKWENAFKEVPIFHKGTWITYTVTESGVDQTVYTETTIATNEDESVTITNKHVPELKDIIARKNWDDNDDNDGKRPVSVEITLFAGENELETLTATADTNWEVTFKDYPVYENGNEIEYTVKELVVDSNYEMTDVSADYVITNTHQPMTITYTVIKNWEDFDNNDGVRPDHITVHLVGKVGVETVVTRDIDVYEAEDGTWSYKFEDLPKYSDKSLIQYTITEDEVQLYTTQEIETIENTEETTDIENTIVNSHDKIPYNEDGMITVNKYWDDENNKYEKRPESITINLLADGEVVASAELDEDTGWTYTFEHLPKYTIRDGVVGVEIVYTIEEVEVEYYETTYDGFDIYNKYNGPVPEITPPPTGVMMDRQGNNNVLFEMIISMITAAYALVALRKIEQ